MAIRYFKGTDGRITAFRASESMAYTGVMTKSPNLAHRISFTTSFAKPLPAGYYPVEEITESEYRALQMLKLAEDAKRSANRSKGPQDSWIPNKRA
jgi:hypothetical protein